MSRVTRSHTIRRHLVEGGLVDLGLDIAAQQAGPDGHETDGFSVRQHRGEGDALVVVAGAYGPNWLRTLAEISGRLEERHIRCTVIAEAPAVADHEVLVRWATSAELQARTAAREARQAPLRRLLREQKANEQRQALEDAGQPGLF
ncbi:hypothetical protein [Streptomyces sp. SP18BB07]|uniref:hypothetical protein n=1 Tax=Streptomyces sp. SP18BB07 TaxID=3002522 RepID=UPI002E76807F|nr:hypothetical protein [Streptomyces sp. SP18BB07]MEE1764457.1 hypothetical protein [Streptomyces sp. SP18BB07]